MATDRSPLPVTQRWQSGLVLPFVVVTQTFLLFYAIIASAAPLHDVTDSALYRFIARKPLSSDVLFADKRPPLYPLLIRICDNADWAILAVQTTVYFAAWILLAWTLYSSLPRVSGLAIASITYYLALYPNFAGWNHVALSESLPLSFAVAGLAFLFRTLLGGNFANLWYVVLLTWFGLLTRDQNAGYAVLLVVPVTILMIGRRDRPIPCVAIIALLLLGFEFDNFTANHAYQGPMEARWIAPYLDVFGQRILPDPAAVQYFQGQGMPVNSALTSMAGEFFYGRDWSFFRDPDLAAFRDWLLADGKSAYVSYLISHPWHALASFCANAGGVLLAGPEEMHWYFDPAYRTYFWPALPFAVLYVLLIGGVTWLIAGAWSDRRRERVFEALFALSNAAIVLPLALLVFHAEGMEFWRHSVGVQLLAVVTGLLAATLILRRYAKPSPIQETAAT